MSRRKIVRGRTNKRTQFYENGKLVTERPASRTDKEWTGGSKHYIRVSSTTPNKNKK